MRSLVVGLAAAAIAAPVAQGGFQARSERSQVAGPAASFYSSQAYHALMVRSEAMNALYSKHPSTSVARPDDRAGVRGTGTVETPQVVTASGDGFDWGDAAIGAGVALGAVIVLTGGVALSRRNRTAPLAV
jgi:hypothetical protein